MWWKLWRSLHGSELRAAVINGIVQIVAGAVAIAFGIGFSEFDCGSGGLLANLRPGEWCGVFFIAGGILMLIAGCKRSFGCTIAALIFAVLNFIFGASFLVFVVAEYQLKEYTFRCWFNMGWRELDPMKDCPDGDYQLAMFMLAASILAAFAELFSVIWAVVITTQALCRGGCSGGIRATTAPEVHSNVKAHNQYLRINWVCQLAATIVCAVATCVILFIVAYGVQSGRHDRRVLYLQKMGLSLWCAPVYLLAAFCGFRAWRFGENSSLISFLALNILQLPLCPTELAFSAFAIYYNRGIYGMSVVNRVNRDVNAYALADKAYRYRPALITFHAIVIISAFIHFCLTIWGIVAAAIAIHQDDACSCGGCCCADDDDDRAEFFYVASSATPESGNVQADNYAAVGAPVVYQNCPDCRNVGAVGDVVHPPNFAEAVNMNHVC